METIERISQSDLALHPHRVIRLARQGQTIIVESQGQPEVAIIDIVDYRILRAVTHYYAHTPTIAVPDGLAEVAVTSLVSPQERYTLVFSHYLAGAISLSRAAELLDLSWSDLRNRCLRLDVPLRTAPLDSAEIQADIATGLFQ